MRLVLKLIMHCYIKSPPCHHCCSMARRTTIFVSIKKEETTSVCPKRNVRQDMLMLSSTIFTHI